MVELFWVTSKYISNVDLYGTGLLSSSMETRMGWRFRLFFRTGDWHPSRIQQQAAASIEVHTSNRRNKSRSSYVPIS
jgi:hypothetical protein